jgi:TetR/AcrR family transcriptional regulator, repressor of fatR-cypB operon
MTSDALPFFVSDADSPAKRAILVAALQLFASQGVDGVSIRDIAAEAGFSNPALFRHFDSKEALALALFEACYRRLAGVLAGPTGVRTLTLQERIAGCLAMIEASPESVHFVLENLRRYWPQLPEDVRKSGLVGAMRRLVQAEQRAGRVRASIDPQLAGALVLGVLGQMARLAHFNELPRPPSALSDDIWALINDGIGA